MAGHSDNDMGLPEFVDPVKVAIVIAPYYTKISEQQLASARAVLHVGAPAAGTNVIIPVSTGVVVWMLATHGEATVAGFGAATRVESLALVIFYAMSSMIGPFAGQNHGAGPIIDDIA